MGECGECLFLAVIERDESMCRQNLWSERLRGRGMDGQRVRVRWYGRGAKSEGNEADDDADVLVRGAWGLVEIESVRMGGALGTQMGG